jgi:hypothetical protein
MRAWDGHEVVGLAVAGPLLPRTDALAGTATVAGRARPPGFTDRSKKLPRQLRLLEAVETDPGSGCAMSGRSRLRSHELQFAPVAAYAPVRIEVGVVGHDVLVVTIGPGVVI